MIDRKGVRITDFAESAKTIDKELEVLRNAREKLLTEGRSIINLAADAIVKIHTGRNREARADLEKARRLLKRLESTSVELRHYLRPMEAEFVEAKALYSVIERHELPSHSELHVAGSSYLMGMLDLVGELKRYVYTMIREGKSDDALTIFNLMEQLYLQFIPFAEYDNTVKGVRRKLDVARILVEDARAAVTEEVRRRDLIRNLEAFSANIKRYGYLRKDIGKA